MKVHKNGNHGISNPRIKCQIHTGPSPDSNWINESNRRLRQNVHRVVIAQQQPQILEPSSQPTATAFPKKGSSAVNIHCNDSLTAESDQESLPPVPSTEDNTSAVPHDYTPVASTEGSPPVMARSQSRRQIK